MGGGDVSCAKGCAPVRTRPPQLTDPTSYSLLYLPYRGGVRTPAHSFARRRAAPHPRPLTYRSHFLLPTLLTLPGRGCALLGTPPQDAPLAGPARSHILLFLHILLLTPKRGCAPCAPLRKTRAARRVAGPARSPILLFLRILLLSTRTGCALMHTPLHVSSAPT